VKILKKIKSSLVLFFDNQCIDYRFLNSFLANEKLCIADVGSTGGLDSRWISLNNILQIYTFDPDPRSKTSFNQNINNFSIGLWSSKKKLPLYLTRYPDASSVFKPNKNILDSYTNADDHDVIKKLIIDVDCLDKVLNNKKYPDFIKVDAEGADFEILLGAKHALKSSCLGLQVEAQFIERNTGSAFFSDIDNLLKKNGFIMYDLNVESWLRKNKFKTVDSLQQVIWADITYILSIDGLVNRCKNYSPEKRRKSLSKILLISMAYKFYDYSIDILTTFNKLGWITDQEKNIGIAGIKKNMKSTLTVISLCCLKVIFTLILLIFSLLTPSNINSSYNRFRRSLQKLLITLSKCFS